jgi:hypothetical protein
MEKIDKKRVEVNSLDASNPAALNETKSEGVEKR